MGTQEGTDGTMTPSLPAYSWLAQGQHLTSAGPVSRTPSLALVNESQGRHLPYLGLFWAGAGGTQGSSLWKPYCKLYSLVCGWPGFPQIEGKAERETMNMREQIKQM